jgi:hypothetical protein
MGFEKIRPHVEGATFGLMIVFSVLVFLYIRSHHAMF